MHNVLDLSHLTVDSICRLWRLQLRLDALACCSGRRSPSLVVSRVGLVALVLRMLLLLLLLLLRQKAAE